MGPKTFPRTARPPSRPATAPCSSALTESDAPAALPGRTRPRPRQPSAARYTPKLRPTTRSPKARTMSGTPERIIVRAVGRRRSDQDELCKEPSGGDRDEADPGTLRRLLG